MPGSGWIPAASTRQAVPNSLRRSTPCSNGIPRPESAMPIYTTSSTIVPRRRASPSSATASGSLVVGPCKNSSRLSASWSYIGTKASMTRILSEFTSIDPSVLTFQKHFGEVSVACRMSWACRRHTSRVEDEAYCLTSIFDDTMPTIYGQGREAFRRLQEQIMWRTSDQTLFAWGAFLDVADLTRRRAARDARNCNSSLFARSPSDFAPSPLEYGAAAYYEGPNTLDPVTLRDLEERLRIHDIRVKASYGARSIHPAQFLSTS
ncbi:hypothetical protein BV20DRAFT_658224 [Pilatotrama ljubarskyi]|nr:hypothetical protein BV20DRAFT_658224 [Pilatotrama ljubarskyi]